MRARQLSAIDCCNSLDLIEAKSLTKAEPRELDRAGVIDRDEAQSLSMLGSDSEQG